MLNPLARYRRSAMTYGLYDFGPLTLAFCSNFICDGGHRWPMVNVIFRDRWVGKQNSSRSVVRYRSFSFPLPYVRFSTGYRFKRIGLLWVHCKFSRAYHRMFGTRYATR